MTDDDIPDGSLLTVEFDFELRWSLTLNFYGVGSGGTAKDKLAIFHLLGAIELFLFHHTLSIFDWHS